MSSQLLWMGWMQDYGCCAATTQLPCSNSLQREYYQCHFPLERNQVLQYSHRHCREHPLRSQHLHPRAGLGAVALSPCYHSNLIARSQHTHLCAGRSNRYGKAPHPTVAKHCPTLKINPPRGMPETELSILPPSWPWVLPCSGAPSPSWCHHMPGELQPCWPSWFSSPNPGFASLPKQAQGRFGLPQALLLLP